jgi:hypothetical protein
MENPVSAFMSPSDRVAQLYLRALDSLFVTFCDSQGYSGVLIHFHMVKIVNNLL